MAEDIGSKKGVYNTERFKRKRPEAEQSSASNDVEEDDYFQRTSLLVYIVVLFGMITFEILCFQTHLYPFEMLGSVGARLQFLASNHMEKLRLGFIMAVLLHIFEAAYAHFQCRAANLSQSATTKWTIQTFLLGYASLKDLNAYCEKKASKKAF